MTTVAIVGADGAGKTRLARQLEEAATLPVRYMYMGANIESANVSLPTSRLMLRWKLASYRRDAAERGISDPGYVSTHHAAHRGVRYGKLASTIRLANRIAEMCYRLLVAGMWQLRGYVVIYDRHFAVDASLVDRDGARMTDRLYHRLAAGISPEPDLVIFLDAPPEVLLRRKGEGTVESLTRHRQAYAAKAQSMRNVVRVDASRPFADVVAEATDVIATVMAGDVRPAGSTGTGGT